MVLENILSQEIIQKLGWTLLHFVWQAAAVTLLLGILLALLRKSSANLRYIVACAALGLIILLPIVTMKLVPVSTQQRPTDIEPSPTPAVLTVEPVEQTPLTRALEYMEMTQPENVGTATPVHWKQQASELLELSLPYLVTGWLLGVFGLSLWHLGGWAQLQRLRKKMVKRVDDSVQNRLLRLSEKLHIRQTVQLLESALVQVPTVVGWLRPVILLPASALTGLASDQLEALLAHELAHIRRYDYLVNMLQTIVETLGFYHPAVWWISHKIRIERENCCDDLAVSISGDRISYARALTSMEEIRDRHRKLAVAASGGNLFERIRRLLGKDSTNSSRTSWIPSVITILLIAIIALPASIALTTHVKHTDKKVEIESNQVVIKLVDANSQPVVGAWVGTYVDWSDIAESPPIWFLNDGGSYKASESEYAAKIISNEEGKINLTEEQLFKSQWPIERTVPITAIDEGHHLAGLQELSREHLGTEVTVQLQPACRVHGLVSTATARKRKWSTKNLTVYVDWDVLRPCQYSSEQGRFEIILPPGKYNVKVYSTDPDKAITLPIQIQPGQRDLDLTKYLDGTSLPPVIEAENQFEGDKGRIEGKIIDINTGQGIAAVQLAAVMESSPESDDRFSCTSGDDGTFAISGLQSGEYLLQGDIPSVNVDVVSGRSTNDVLIGIHRDRTEPALKESTTNQQDNGQIIIGMRMIQMSADTMKEVFGPNENFSNGLLVRLGHEIAGRLLTLTQKGKDAKLIVAPQILLNNNSNGTIALIKKELFIRHYVPIEGELGKLALQLQPLEIGWKFKIHAKILEGGEKVHIELAAKQQEAGFETRQYRPGYDYQIPSPPEIFATELTAKNSEPVAIGRLRRGETAYCLIATPSVILPEPKPEPLLGKKLPEPGNIQNVDYILKQVEGIPILVCFWDMNQRPSRNFFVELGKRQNELKAKGITVLAIDTSQEEPAKLKEWLDNQNVQFVCGNIEGDSKEVLLAWGVQAQPWLILTDEKGIVRAEGFSLDQLDEKFQRKIPDVLIEFWEKSNKSLHKAVADGDIEQVRLLLSKGFDVREKDENDQTALHIAAEYGHKNVAELLLSRGADVNAKGSGDWTAMHSAAVHGYTDLAELLITKGANVNVKDKNGKTPLHFASEGRVDLAELLIEKGANVDAKDISHGQTPLHTATADVAEILLNNGADINAKNKWGQMPLHCTAGLGSKNVMEFLLANGANVNAVDDSGNTPLHFAAEQGHKAMVELLIAKGAIVNAKNTNTDTPLHKAAYQGHKEVVELLLGIGADLNAKNKWGWTPLHHAVTQGHRDVVEFLIANGADMNAKDNQNRSPLQWAKNIGHKEIIELLQKHKAKNTPAEQSTANNSKVPVLSKSAAPSGVDKPIVKVDLSVVEVSSDSKMDKETIIEIENLLAGKITIPDPPAVADLLRKAAGIPAVVEDESAGDKRVTQEQFSKLFDTLLSRGFVKILMRPTLEVVDNQTAKISSEQKVPGMQNPLEASIRITPHVSQDGKIILLQVEAAFSSQTTPPDNGQTPFVDRREIATMLRLSPGESGIIGGTKQTGIITKPGKVAKDFEEPATEILVILKPTIVASAEPKEPMETINFENVRTGTIIEKLTDWTDKTIIPHADLLKQKITIRAPEKLPRSKAAAMILNSLQSKGYTVEQTNETIFIKPVKDERPGISKDQILVDTKILTAGDEFLKDIGIDPNSPASSEGWSDYLIHSTDGSAGFIIDQLHTDLILKAAATHRDIKVLHKPQVLAESGKKCEIHILKPDYYTLTVPTEPNTLSGQPEPESRRIKLGATVRLTPTLTPDGKNIELDFEWEYRRLRGVTEHTGPDGNVQKLPRIDVDRIKTPCTIPDGKTLFITGPKINYELESESRTPILSELPAVGGLFRSSSKVTETQTALILITPSTVIKTPPKPRPVESK